MKKLLVLSAFAVSGLVAFAQGTINFNNRVTADGINAPVTDGFGVKLDGIRYQAQLLAGPNAASIVPIVASITPFRTGSVTGYFNGGSVAVATVAPGAVATVQIRAWDTQAGATYDSAVASGYGFGTSKVFTVTTGGAGDPPGVPGNMLNLGTDGFSLAAVPEPSVVALGLLGAVGLLIRRRKA